MLQHDKHSSMVLILYVEKLVRNTTII